MTDFGDYPGNESCNRINTEMAKTAYRDVTLKHSPSRKTALSPDGMKRFDSQSLVSTIHPTPRMTIESKDLSALLRD